MLKKIILACFLLAPSTSFAIHTNGGGSSSGGGGFISTSTAYIQNTANPTTATQEFNVANGTMTSLFVTSSITYSNGTSFTNLQYGNSSQTPTLFSYAPNSSVNFLRLDASTNTVFVSGNAGDADIVLRPGTNQLIQINLEANGSSVKKSLSLQHNAFSITSNIALAPLSTAVSSFTFLDTSGLVGVGFKSSDTVPSTVIWTLPQSDSSGCWKSDGNKHLYLAACGGSSSGVSIGDPIGSGNPQSLLFVDGSGNLGQDTNFTYTTGALSIFDTTLPMLLLDGSTTGVPVIEMLGGLFGNVQLQVNNGVTDAEDFFGIYNTQTGNYPFKFNVLTGYVSVGGVTSDEAYPFHVKGKMLLEGGSSDGARFYVKSNDGGNAFIFNRYPGQEAYNMFFGENGDTGNVSFRGQGKYYFGDETTPALFASQIDTNVGINTASPDADASLTIDHIFAVSEPASCSAAEDDFSTGLYANGQQVQYRIWAYRDGVFSSNYCETSLVTFDLGGDQASNQNWSASSGADGYIVELNLDGAGWGTLYYDAGNITAFSDVNDGSNPPWIGGAPTLTPTGFTNRILYNYSDGTDKWAVYPGTDSSNSGYFQSPLATTVLANAAGYGGIFKTNQLENTVPAGVFVKDNSGLGTNNDLETGRSNLTLWNPNGSAQGEMTFCHGGTSALDCTIDGGLRWDHAGNLSWESFLAHYFFVSGTGTEHIAGSFIHNANGDGYGLTVNSSNQPTGSTVLDVYGTSNFRNTLTGTTVVSSSETTTNFNATASTTSRLNVTTAAILATTTINGKLTVTGAIDPYALIIASTSLGGSNTAYFEMASGSATAVSGSNRGRIIYNAGLNKFQFSNNAGQYLNVASTADVTSTGASIVSASTGVAAGTLASNVIVSSVAYNQVLSVATMTVSSGTVASFGATTSTITTLVGTNIFVGASRVSTQTYSAGSNVTFTNSGGNITIAASTAAASTIVSASTGIVAGTLPSTVIASSVAFNQNITVMGLNSSTFTATQATMTYVNIATNVVQNDIVSSNTVTMSTVTTLNNSVGYFLTSNISTANIQMAYVSASTPTNAFNPVRVGGVFQTFAGPQGNSAGSESTILGPPYKANSLPKNGDSLYFLVTGTTSSSANVDKVLRIAFGVEYIYSITFPTASAMSWRLECNMVRMAKTREMTSCTMETTGATVFALSANNVTNQGFDVDEGINVNVSGTSANDVTITTGYVEYRPGP